MMGHGKVDRSREAALSHARVREALHYDPETGVFTWLVTNSSRAIAGRPAGHRQTCGSRVIVLDLRRYVAHRLAWFWMTGRWPTHLVDHRNMDADDNRWKNLREATKTQNSANRGAQKNSRSGSKGVYHVPGYYVREKADAWKAEITVNGQSYRLGYYRTVREAAAAYLAAAKEHFGEFARAA